MKGMGELRFIDENHRSKVYSTVAIDNLSMELSNEEKGSPEHESYWKSPYTRVIRLFIAFTLFMYISKSGKNPPNAK